MLEDCFWLTDNERSPSFILRASVTTQDSLLRNRDHPGQFSYKPGPITFTSEQQTTTASGVDFLRCGNLQNLSRIGPYAILFLGGILFTHCHIQVELSAAVVGW